MNKALCEILENPRPLSTQQKRAVLSRGKYLQIIAGAGSGKTETMTRKILYYLIIEKCDPKAIVAFTFTEKAAENIKSRVHQRLLDLNKDDLLRKFGQMYIGTIHGFCSRLLEDHEVYSDYDTLDDNQEMALLLREGYNIGLNKEGHVHHGSYVDRCGAFIESLNVVYGELIKQKVIDKKAPHFYKMMKRYEKLLENNRRLTFNLLIYKVVSEIVDNPKRIKFIKHLIVDEFQDINKAQYTLIKSIGKIASVSIVGDPRQSIYQWRGGNSSFFDSFCKDFKKVERIAISENRRSVKNIVDISNIISNNLDGQTFEQMNSLRPEDGLVIKTDFENEYDEAAIISQKIAELVDTKKVKYSDIAILYRSVGSSAQPMINSFKDADIPYVVGGVVGLFKREEIQAIGRLIVWLCYRGYWQPNPYNWDKKEFDEELLEKAIQIWTDLVKIKINTSNLKKELRNWKQMVIKNGITEEYQYNDILYELFVILGYKNLDQNNDLDAALMANLGRFSNIIGDFQSTFRLGGYRRNTQGELFELCKFINNYAAFSYKEKHEDEKISGNYINIMTIHQAKGLEWPIVFMPSMIGRRFPKNKKEENREKDAKKRWMIPIDLFDYLRYIGSKDDEKRLFYVATTRAMNVLIFSSFKSYGKSGTKCKESEFLDMVKDKTKIISDFKKLTLKKEKLTTKGIDNYLDTFTVKEIIDYEMCPYHYRFSKKWGYVQKVGTFEGYGAVMHSCLKRITILIKEGKSINNAVDLAVEEGFFLPYAVSEINKKQQTWAKKNLNKFVEKHLEDIKNVRETETRIEFPTESATVTGRVDVILNAGNPNKVEVRDYKTSEKVIEKEHSELQIRLYSEGLKSFDVDVIKGSISDLDNNRTTDVNVSNMAIQDSLREAKAVITQIKEGEFSAKPTKFCKICEYKTLCKWTKS